MNARKTECTSSKSVWGNGVIINTLPFVAIVFIVLSASCSTSAQRSRPLMEVPVAIADTVEVSPQATADWDNLDSTSLLYATARYPADEGEPSPYLNQRDILLHLGKSRIIVDDENANWDVLNHWQYLTESGNQYPIAMKDFEEFGPLDEGLHGLVEPDRYPLSPSDAPNRFAGMINQRLEGMPSKDIYIYVHGVNSSFEDPLLTAAEFWHFMGYRGTFLAFSWASAQSILEYVSDVDSAEYTSWQFRHFLEFLSEETIAERIHILAYSAGTKLVTQALYQIQLMHYKNTFLPNNAPRLGQVVFVAGDVERMLFGLYAGDGLLQTADHFTVYTSDSDQALKASQNIHKQARLGQPWTDEEQIEIVGRFLETLDNIDFVNVSGLPGTKENYGHEYFRKSSWVSSDLLAVLLRGLSPAGRGLERKGERLDWSFPEDYPERISSVAAEHVTGE